MKIFVYSNINRLNTFQSKIFINIIQTVIKCLFFVWTQHEMKMTIYNCHLKILFSFYLFKKFLQEIKTWRVNRVLKNERILTVQMQMVFKYFVYNLSRFILKKNTFLRKMYYYFINVLVLNKNCLISVLVGIFLKLLNF